MRMGVMGAKGSFSEEAARTYAKKYGKFKIYDISYLITAENVLSSLENGSIDLAIFPIENSTGGVVLEALYAMAKYNFSIERIFEIDIRQNLLVRRGVTRREIKVITSHEQALKQCRGYLRKKWPKAKLVEYEDTAKAAEDLAKGKLPPSTAVIASRTAAELYKLTIFGKAIQDQKLNYTSFIAARHALTGSR